MCGRHEGTPTTEERRADRVKAALTWSAMTLCVGGFGWLVSEQVENYIHRRTSVAVRYQNVRFHEVPDVAFCLQDPFHPNVTWTMLKAADTYDSVVKTPQVSLSGIARDDYDIDFNVPKYEWTYINTMYNGKCRRFRLKEKLETATYLNFVASVDSMPLDMFLMYPGEEIFLMWQSWGFASMTHTQIDKTVAVALYPNRYKLLEEPNGLDCRGGKPSSLTECLTERTRKNLGEFACVPKHVASNFHLNAKDCLSGQSGVADDVIRNVSETMSAFEMRKLCKISCEKVTYKVSSIPLAPIPEGPFGSGGSSNIFVYFSTSVEKLHEQYYVHDFVSIVSAVGGGLGLFLGFSCFTIASKASSFLHKALKRIPTGDQNSVDFVCHA